ncbi:hypothetical protein B0A49_04287 [Cryomyces minteri]|uniref:Uncharacterized protein n=1 Tax=Cryomyces minteri TaxID=331657 RepID=A0A4U0XQF1_9PEZI|nr:hypothetical protein B0A49_04287 [Cryomyces minteri]
MSIFGVPSDQSSHTHRISTGVANNTVELQEGATPEPSAEEFNGKEQEKRERSTSGAIALDSTTSISTSVETDCEAHYEEADGDPPSEFGPKYELRHSARLSKPAFATWVDEDDSGNYDPSAENRRLLPVKRKRVALVDLSASSTGEEEPTEDSEPKRPKVYSWLTARQAGVSLVVSLKLNSEEGKALLRKHPDNWPDAPWNVLDDDHCLSNDNLNHRGKSSTLLDDEPYGLRSKFGALEVDETSGNHPVRGSCELTVALTGHPAARGTTKIKRDAKKNQIVTGNGALQPSSFIDLTGSTDGEDSTKRSVEPRRGKEKAPRQLLESYITTSRVPHYSELVDSDDTDMDGAKAKEPVKPMKPLSEKRIIRTSLAHPVAFNHDPPDDGSAPCHFCSGPQYGIMGLGSRDIEVVEPASGKGYEEICGGHRGEGQEASRICVLCTMQRVRICICTRHEVRLLEHVSPENMDFVTAFESLMSDGQMMQSISLL